LSKYVTDSGTEGTAIATGKKANNSAIGVDSANRPVPSIIEVAKSNSLEAENRRYSLTTKNMLFKIFELMLIITK